MNEKEANPEEGDGQRKRTYPTEGGDQRGKTPSNEGEGQRGKDYPSEGEGQRKPPVPAEGEGRRGKDYPSEGEGQRKQPIPAEGEGQRTPVKPAVPLSSCLHQVTFQKLDSSAVTTIRVRPYSGGASIASALAPAGWVSTSTPAAVFFKPQAGGIIPQGSHSGFKLNITLTPQGQQYVLVEWLNASGNVVCGQPLYVPCGNARGAAPSVPPPYTGPTCGCLNATTGADDDSDILDADIEVTLGQITSAGFLKFKVPYTVEIDPIGMPVTKTWQVITFDESGDEVVLNVQPTSDAFNAQTGQGLAVFTVAQGGQFDVTLSVKSNLTCLSGEGNREDPEDEDSGGYETDESVSVIDVMPSDPCDPLKYTFTDKSDTVGLNPVWSVAQVGFAPQTITLDSTGSYQFPTPNVPYQVCLAADDPITLAPRPVVCKQVTPQIGAPDVKFVMEDYNSCVSKNFVVKFKNQTQNATCPATWTWDFGDNTPVSHDQDPTHTFVNPGTYTVTLDANGTQYSQTVTIAHWSPTIAPPVDCGDGTVLWSTQDGSFPNGRKWTPSGGKYCKLKRNFKKLRVCYSAPGTYEMTLWARNSDGGKCEVKSRVEIKNIVRCCRRDRDSQMFPFTLGGKSYRMVCKLRFRGWLGRVFVKTKLQVLKNGIWRRKKATNITAEFNGKFYGKSGDCHCVTPNDPPWIGPTEAQRAKVSMRWFLGGGTYRIRKGELISRHIVVIDGHWETNTLKLWVNDCDCGWKH